MNQMGMGENGYPQGEFYGQEAYDDMRGLTSKSVVSRTGMALAVFAAVVIGVQYVIVLLLDRIKPEIMEADWYGWALTAFSLIIIGLPIFLLLIRRAPDSPKREVVKLKPLSFICIFFICTAAMYISSFIGSFITLGIAFIKGKELVNPVVDVMLNSNYILTLIYAVIVAPIIEELIFRKFLLNKLRRFGDVPAILMTGIAFGLFHMNLSQFFYATVLGFIFAYVALKTNTIRYSILLHMMINGIGTLATPLVSENNIFAVMMLLLWMLLAVTLGVVLFIVNFKKIKLEKSSLYLRTRDYILNAGTICYTLVCMLIIVLATIG